MTTGRINQVDARAETRREIAFTPRPLYDRNSENRTPPPESTQGATGGNMPSITDIGRGRKATLRQFCLCAPIDAPFTERIHLNVSMERHYMSHALKGARRLAAVAGHCAGFK